MFFKLIKLTSFLFFLAEFSKCEEQISSVKETNQLMEAPELKENHQINEEKETPEINQENQLSEQEESYYGGYRGYGGYGRGYGLGYGGYGGYGLGYGGYGLGYGGYGYPYGGYGYGGYGYGPRGIARSKRLYRANKGLRKRGVNAAYKAAGARKYNRYNDYYAKNVNVRRYKSGVSSAQKYKKANAINKYAVDKKANVYKKGIKDAKAFRGYGGYW